MSAPTAAAAAAVAGGSAAASVSPLSPPLLPVQSVLGDTSEWEGTAADVDFDSGDEGDIVEKARNAAAGSDAATDAALLAKVASAAHAAAAARQAGSFATFVKESEEIAQLLLRLPYDEAAPTRLCAILDEYQEQGELLDPHLPHAVTTLMNYVHSVIRPGKQTPVPPPNSTTGAIKEGTEGDAGAGAAAVAQYTPSAPACSSSLLITRVFQVVYGLAKVRGYKTILHFFPHEVADLEPTLELLRAQNMDDHTTWETRYGLLLWLSIIVLIPFDLSSVDSTLGAAPVVPSDASAAATSTSTSTPAAAVADGSTGIIASLISLGCQYLGDTGPPRDAAAVMLSKLFSRADMHARHLAAFCRWSTDEMSRVASEKESKLACGRGVFLLTGICRALVEIFRHAPRDVLLKHVGLVYEPILLQHEKWASSSNTLLRKLFIKLSQRVGLVYLPVRVAKWRYQRGHRSLLTTLQQSTAAAAAAASSASSSNPALGSSSSFTPAVATSAADDEEEEDVPSEMEVIVQILLDGLRDRDTIVRWSSAKGIGRITNCLAADFGDDVVGSVLDLFSGRESDAAWHGGCLALAELARRGLLLPARLDAVVPITLRALTYDQRTSTHSVGAHVRDASCYVIWAFARAYAPEVMSKFMHSMATGLITIGVFDREVNVRRAASAAFQEHVGRQGSASFPHGMAVLQLADYFTLSNRAHAYKVVSFQVGAFEEYTLPLIEHLLVWKVRHWEKEIRVLTAATLGILTRRNAQAQEYMRDVVVQSLLAQSLSSTDLAEKHGSLLAVASILLSLHEMDAEGFVTPSVRMEVCKVLNALTGPANTQMLNGRGGQIMREALCTLLDAVARTRMLVTNDAMRGFIRSYQTVIDDNLVHTNEEVQNAAVAALGSYVRAYYLPAEGDQPRVVTDKLARAKPVMDHYTRTLMHPSSLAGATRGFASALGTMPRALLVTTVTKATDVYATSTAPATPAATTAAATSSAAVPAASAAPLPSVPPTASSLIYQPLSRILQALILSTTEHAQPDAETRRNAVHALVKLVDTLSEEDLLQFMPPMPVPPPAAAAPAVSIAAPPAAAAAATPAAAGSAALSAAREKEAKLAQKLAKARADALNKYWHRDLSGLGLGPGANRVSERIATALLMCLDDYATDNRGDVGSWVREAAMVGLEVLLQKLARMHSYMPPEAHAFPPLLSQRAFPALLKQSVEKIDRVREKAGQIFFRLLWAGADAPTATAGGNGASSTATSSTAASASAAAPAAGAPIPFIPCRDELRRRFPRHAAASGANASARSVKEDKAIDWSSPTQTFPVLVPLLAITDSAERAADESSAAAATAPASPPASAAPLSASPSPSPSHPYRRALLSGLLISVGGLTESVVKSSSDSFLLHVSSLCSTVSEGGADAGRALRELKELAEELLAILTVERGYARVVVPAFKTLELLLSHGMLDALTPEVTPFAQELQERVWKEVGRSSNIHKLMAAIPVLVGLLPTPSPSVRSKCLQCLLTLLGHATFPKVRRLTAEALYTALLTSDELIPGAEEDPEKAQPVWDVLSLTAWDGPVATARTQRDALYNMLGVTPPKLKAKTAAGATAVRADAASVAAANAGDISALSNEYSTLVRNIGY